MERVYLVVFDWTVEDDSNVEVFVFNSYEKAKRKLNEIKKEEMNPDMSWVGSCAFDNDELQEGYVVDENENYWECYEDGYENEKHSTIRIIEEEVL